MVKDKNLHIRVRSEQLKKLDDLGYNYCDCWELGYERILENEREELVKLEKKYYDLYTHVHTKLENFGKKLESEHEELKRLLKWYKKQAHRSIDNPSDEDIQTVTYQMKKRDIHSFTVEQVFEYWRSLNGRQND